MRFGNYSYKIIWPLLQAAMTLSDKFKLVIAFSIGVFCGLYLGKESNRYLENHNTSYSKANSLVREYTATIKRSIELEDDSKIHNGEFSLS